MTGLIYEPRGRAREYAALACNTYRGCAHRCIYCYAPDATFQQREAFSHPHNRGPKFLADMEKEARKVATAGTQDRVLLCFTTDPYQPLEQKEGITREAIQSLHNAGLAVQVLTKGGSRALRDLDLFTSRDAFATTLTLLDEAASREWEPGAATPLNRMVTIQEFHAAGIPTWVSLEPVLDPEVALEIIRRTHKYVDLYKVGKLNYHPHAKTIDWGRFARESVELLKSLGKNYYIKQDLQRYLPKAA